MSSRTGIEMRKAIKTAAILLAAVILGSILFVVNAFCGNPVSCLLARHGAKGYVADNYPDYAVTAVHYNIKDSGYNAFAEVPGSLDRHFSVCTDMLGRVKGDFYGNVENHITTYYRLEEEYRTITEAVFDDLSAAMNVSVGFGELQTGCEEGRPGEQYSLNLDELVTDGEYDIRALGTEYGHLVVYINSNNISIPNAAELLLQIREAFDKAEVPFRAIDFNLREDPKTVPDYREIYISNFSYVDITQENLERRVEDAYRALDEWYNWMDSEKMQSIQGTEDEK